jgi:uncharacterized protein (TIGR03118 family)
MTRYKNLPIHRIIATIAVASALIACGDDDDTIVNVTPVTPDRFNVTKLVSDVNGAGALNVDPKLVNSWGLAFGPTGILWVANEATGTSTLYDVNGVPQSLVVTIPKSGAATGGQPTGIVFNSTSSFVLPGGNPALFLFAGIDGAITAWNAGTSAQVVVDGTARGAEYIGVAIASNAGANFLYGANFKNNAIDMFDTNFQLVKSFTDPNIPAGYGPFNVQAIGGKLWVAYAQQQAAPNNGEEQTGAGLGFVDIFNADGSLAARFASNGNLNAPWGMTVAPAGFGAFTGDILIGNFGDGRIGVYDPTSGAFIDWLRDVTDNPIVLDGLWGITPGPSTQPASLFFASGPNAETHGLVGKITLR